MILACLQQHSPGNASRGCYCARCEKVRARKLTWQREHGDPVADRKQALAQHHANREYHVRRLRYTRQRPIGLLYRAWAHLQQRATDPECCSRAYGKPYLEQQEFVSRFQCDIDFLRLWLAWHASGFDARLVPSVDRMDATQGYELSNIQWLPLEQNQGKQHQDFLRVQEVAHGAV